MAKLLALDLGVDDVEKKHLTGLFGGSKDEDTSATNAITFF